MNFSGSNIFKKYARVLVSPGLESDEQAARIRAVQRDIVLPVKTLLVLALVYYFYFSNWLDPKAQPSNTREVAVETAGTLFLVYVAINVMTGIVLIYVKHLPLLLLQWMVFTVGLLDALLFASLCFFTGGYDSIIYWVFLGLILHNAASIPLATPQIVLNLCVTVSYILAGLVDMAVRKIEIGDAAFNKAFYQGTRHALDLDIQENPTEPFVMRVVILLLMTVCCFGVQAILEIQRRRYEEALEFAVRRAQLQTAGRLSAEIAHRLKNPLGIINNAAYTLNRSLSTEKASSREQIQIVREEVERADRILTELMDYARLAEGKVEKLDVVEELERAIVQVFPPAAQFDVKIERNYLPHLPALMMQRIHFSEVVVNILQNAREAVPPGGRISIQAHYEEDYTVVLTISDNGPGIPEDKVERIFEAYFTTKEKGTGLGLAIVKHNVEIYGGSVRVESKLGQGTLFRLKFPAKTLFKTTATS